MLVVDSFVAALLTHKTLGVEDFVQLKVFAVHHTARMVGHVDAILRQIPATTTTYQLNFILQLNCFSYFNYLTVGLPFPIGQPPALISF